MGFNSGFKGLNVNAPAAVELLQGTEKLLDMP